MQKSFVAIVAAAFRSCCQAAGRPYPYGDEPYTLNWDSYPRSKRLLKWNCSSINGTTPAPSYVHPKAYLFPHRAWSCGHGLMPG